MMIVGFLLCLEALIFGTAPILFNYYQDISSNCNLEAKITINTFSFFELILCLFWYYRIQTAFKESAFALTKNQSRLFLGSMMFIIVIYMMFVSIFIEGELYKIKLTFGNTFWDKPKYNGYSIICRTDNRKFLLQVIVFLGSVTIITLNILFASIFVNKLRKVTALRRNSYAPNGNTNFNPVKLNTMLRLAQKNTILAMTTVSTTFTLWFILAIIASTSDMYDCFQWLLNLDVCVNLICAFLMFGFHGRYYDKCIKCYPYGDICMRIIKLIEFYRLKQNKVAHLANVPSESIPNAPRENVEDRKL